MTQENAIRYSTGEPCANGHLADRYTCNGKCVECRRLGNRRWRARHRAAITEQQRRFKAEHGACPCCTREQRIARYTKAEMAGVTVDHIIPTSKGGPHCVHNMQLLSLSDNSRKSNRYDPLVEGIQYLQNIGIA